MNNEQKINALKNLSVKPLVIEREFEVVGFDQPENGQVKVLLNDDEFAIIDIDQLTSFNDNAIMFFKDAFYYRSEINELLQSFVSECSTEFKVEKEAV